MFDKIIVWQMISDLSAVATLILFVIYWIGRAWTASIKVKYIPMSVDVDHGHSVDFYERVDFDCGGEEVVLISMPIDIRYVELSYINWDGRGKVDIERVLGKIEYIPCGQTISIKTSLPEGIPNQMVKFEYASGERGEFLLGFDGAGNGNGMCPVKLKVEKTLKSWLYHFMN